MTVIQESSGHVAPLPTNHEHTLRAAGRIVVGVDGSARSMAALTWAVEEALLRGSSVHAVMAWRPVQDYGGSLGVGPALDADDVLASAAATQAARLAEQTASLDVPTTLETVRGHPAWVLVEAAEGADLLVVGSRGHGGFVGMLLGSVSQHVLSHARCPVVVVPDSRSRHGARAA
jgi:nucleotide-binding universal stress UspA family protein